MFIPKTKHPNLADSAYNKAADKLMNKFMKDTINPDKKSLEKAKEKEKELLMATSLICLSACL